MIAGLLMMAAVTATPLEVNRDRPLQACSRAILLAVDARPAATTTVGTHYYVSPSGNDANTGSRSRPWATIHRAAGAVVAGDTVHIMPGLYRTTTTISTNKSGTATARIRWVSDNKWGARIASSGYSWDSSTDTDAGPSWTWHNSGSYVDIEGFDISGDGHIGIYNTGSYVTIRDNNIHDILAPNACGDLQGLPKFHHGSAGIDTDQATNVNVVSNYIHDLATGDPICGSGAHGIYFAYYGPGTIENNLVINVQGDGIETWHRANHLTIANNTVIGRGYTGIDIGNDPCCGTSADYFLVSNNIVVDFKYYGIRENSNGPVGQNNRYIRNVLYNNGKSSALKYNLSLEKGTAVDTLITDPNCQKSTPIFSTSRQQHPTEPGSSLGYCTLNTGVWIK